MKIICLTAFLISTNLFAQGPPQVDPTAPQLTHEEKIKLFDFEDQKQELLDKFQKEYIEQIKPIQTREDGLIKIITEGHPGYHLAIYPGQPWRFEKDAPKLSVKPDARK